MALLRHELRRQVKGPDVTHAECCTLVFDTDAKTLYVEREVAHVDVGDGTTRPQPQRHQHTNNRATTTTPRNPTRGATAPSHGEAPFKTGNCGITNPCSRSWDNTSLPSPPCPSLSSPACNALARASGTRWSTITMIATGTAGD
jgi:hypothetical protein